MHRLRVVITIAAVVVGGFVSAPSLAAPTSATAVKQEDGTFVSHRAVVTDKGARISYSARAGSIPLVDDITGDVTANMFFVAYTADRPAGAKARPLTFAWGGGPGSAATLSEGAPRHVKRGSDQLVDNPKTWLAFSDIVYIDPIGTGYSRMTKPEYAPLFYSTAGDAESITEFIRVYLKRYDVSNPPIFLTGGSYGSMRSALVAERAARRGIPIRGLMVSAQGMTYSLMGSDLYLSLLIPTFTVAAQAHGKLPPDLQADRDRAMREAQSWALNSYLPALTRGNSLGDDERKSIVEQMARYTGLAPALIEANNLRISSEVFAANLLRSERKELGLYDARAKGELRDGKWDATTDPSLMAWGNAYAGMPERLYLMRELGVKSDLLYAGPFGGAWPPPSRSKGDWMSWKWGMDPDDQSSPGLGTDIVMPALINTIERDGSLQVLIGSGVYDVMGPYFAAEYVASRLRPEFKSNITNVRYESGHGVPEEEWRDDAARFIERVLAMPAPQSRRPLMGSSE